MTDVKTQREPLIRISKRESIPRWKAWLYRAIAVLAALLVNAMFIYLVAGVNPIQVYSTMWSGVFGNEIYAWDTTFYTAKLLCIAVALAPAFMMRFWNIGAEGQLLAGALATAYVMINFSELPTPILFTVMFISAVVMGALWGIIPAIFKAKFGTNETLFTLMMNYVAIQLVDFFYNKWKGPASALGKINRATRAGYLPEVFGSQYTISVIIVVLLAVLMFFYMKKTKQGYEIAVVGESQNTARYAGINVTKVIIRTMIISGAVCGICGFMTVAGQEHTIESNSTGGGYGFTAIIVAWLAKFNTIFMALIALFIVFLEKGTSNIADTYDAFDSSASKIIIGIMLFFVIGCEFFINYKMNFRKHKEG